jgi:hypothetical protein
VTPALALATAGGVTLFSAGLITLTLLATRACYYQALRRAHARAAAAETALAQHAARRARHHAATALMLADLFTTPAEADTVLTAAWTPRAEVAYRALARRSDPMRRTK